MLPATQEEIDHVTEYMQSQAPDLAVQFVQKVYSENVLQIRHDVWDVHTAVDRWWVITEPMNLYSQDQFPNMDLALTFHLGLCLRIPRSDRRNWSSAITWWRLIRAFDSLQPPLSDIFDRKSILSPGQACLICRKAG
jgi:hypothetical protein